ncbi:hypothetical protein HFP51_10770 [Parasphingopyxis sp. CP4]|uniref:hypothetical protein n=1 Tax=Parasphingopyxis sp. CP4 TaxID=2724527 RepID=UPI0015A0E162|nr:hypothetical protein [Parasphingopyxis sp. CP4]QLC22615.1 hypothetical protein HFP51_10770 [Parasphingopyxis sp. CP4]
MTKHLTPFAACLLLASPAALVAQEQTDGDVDLDVIDSLFADEEEAAEDNTAPEGDASDDEAETSDEDEAGEDEATEDDEANDEEAAEEEEPPTPSDLTLAFNGYSNCATEAGVELEETGFSLNVIGDEALLRCSGQRAAYVNAFYFSMLPRYPDAPEATIRASAERLVAQSDAALAHLIVEEASAARETREAEAAADEALEAAEAAEDTEGADEESPDSDAPDTPDNDDGEAAADETEPNA